MNAMNCLRCLAPLLFGSAAVASAIPGCGGVADNAADPGPSTPYVGYVNAVASEDLGAGFFRTGTVSLAPASSVADLCASPVTVSGNCCSSPHDLTPPSQYTGVAAGTLTVSDGSTVIASMTTSGSGVQYSGVAMPPWQPGDILQMAASGDVVHAFAGSVQVPSTFVATPGTGGGVVIDRSKDFITTWTPDTHGGDMVTLGMVVSPGATIINCRASDEAGQITIPAQLLANTSAGASVITNVYRSVNTTVTTANATVYMTAATLITWDGTLQ